MMMDDICGVKAREEPFVGLREERRIIGLDRPQVHCWASCPKPLR
jgi:hypothetical protein